MTGYIDDWPLNHIRSIWLNLAVSLFFADQTVTFPNGQGQHKICPLADGWRTVKADRGQYKRSVILSWIQLQSKSLFRNTSNSRQVYMHGCNEDKCQQLMHVRIAYILRACNLMSIFDERYIYG